MFQMMRKIKKKKKKTEIRDMQLLKFILSVQYFNRRLILAQNV